MIQGWIISGLPSKTETMEAGQGGEDDLEQPGGVGGLLLLVGGVPHGRSAVLVSTALSLTR